MKDNICYIVARDKVRPISDEYIETRVYALGNKVMIPNLWGKPIIDPEHCQIIKWSSVMTIENMVEHMAALNYVVYLPEGDDEAHAARKGKQQRSVQPRERKIPANIQSTIASMTADERAMILNMLSH